MKTLFTLLILSSLTASAGLFKKSAPSGDTQKEIDQKVTNINVLSCRAFPGSADYTYLKTDEFGRKVGQVQLHSNGLVITVNSIGHSMEGKIASASGEILATMSGAGGNLLSSHLLQTQQQVAIQCAIVQTN